MEPPNSTQTSQPVITNGNQEPIQKRKRDKYVVKACGPCRRRKIRCGGGIPCRPCVRRKKYCIVGYEEGPENGGIPMSGYGSDTGKQEELLALQQRLATLESHLTHLKSALLSESRLPGPNAPVLPQSPDADGPRNTALADMPLLDTANVCAVSAPSSTSPKEYLSFSNGKDMTTGRNLGETSVVHALQRVEDRLNELGIPVLERDSAAGTSPMTPLPSKTRTYNYDSISRRFKRALEGNGIVPDRATWDGYVEVYLTDVHLLYPFSNETLILEAYEKLWELLGSSDEVILPEIELDKACQMLLVLALGRCTVSTRIHKSEGIHSAGWSLYCTAMDLLGNLLDTVNDDSNPLSRLHSLVLIVMYLLRIDATERSQKVLSLAVIHAQHLGIHLSKTHDVMSSSDSEMFKRTWWCMYVLDRRVSLVLGRPFMIQDNNITVSLPRDIGISTPGSILDFYHMDAEPVNLSPIPYLNVMIGYSRLVGKAWETLFASESSSRCSPYVHDYLDSLVHLWMESVPNFLICDQNDVHQPPISSPQFLFKQRFLVRLRYLYISIIIRSPVRRFHGVSLPSSNNVESDTTCLKQARSIVSMFAQCTAADAVYGFPFLPYLLEATITILSCLTRLPSLRADYRETTEESLRMLTQSCKKSWISGKMARIIFKLGDIIPKIFAPEPSIIPDCPRGSENSTAPLQHGIAQTFGSHLNQPHIWVPHSLNSQPLPSSLAKWPPNLRTANGGPPANSIQGEPQFLTDGCFADSNLQSSTTTDISFEMNFGNAVSHGIAPATQVGGPWGPVEIKDFSTPFLGITDLEWLNELLPDENRIAYLR